MTIAVDFDGTIVEEAYPQIGKPIPFAIDVLKKLIYEDYHHVILWTVREGALLEEAVQYCRQRGVEFYAVNKLHPDLPDEYCSRKIAVDIFMIKNNESWHSIINNPDTTPDNRKKKGLFARMFS